MLNHFRRWRERGWTEIAPSDYAAAWARFGGSVVTHPQIIERLSALADIAPRYLGWFVEGKLIAALSAWGRYLALSKAALKAQGQKGLFDLGNAEIIIPSACVPPGVAPPVLRHSARYLSGQCATRFSGLKKQREQLALARPLADFSSKFRYNQRRELRLLTEAGGILRPAADFSPAEFAAIYLDLFVRRWGFAATGAKHTAEVFELLAEFMTGSIIFLHDAPIAAQVIYRVESPEWVSVEYINGGVDPRQRAFSPGSVLTWKNIEAAWADAVARNKALRYSFGRADRDYKERWCTLHPMFEV
ncbi:MAG: antimicrobial resistance protein Mig-14 [Azoarcus sp.]|jgi:hypothetical protein|nr:antimicrobial resistance protein Mig-14 [Azoarcus sp.]